MQNHQFLQGVNLFAELPEPVVRSLASKMQELQFGKGRLICQENSAGDALFVVKQGLVQIHLGEGQEKKVLAYIKRGDYFGEMAIFSGDPRSASATAVADVTILGLLKKDFENEVRANPSLALEMLKTLSRRLANANLRTGGGATQSGRILVVMGSERGAGKTSMAREVAAGLAKESGARVVLFDPNVQNDAVAKAVGVEETCDLAKELVSSDQLTVDRYVKETEHGFHVLLPQKKEQTTYPLRESHHHILVNALAERFDYLVVDSSSTMAKLNKSLMDAATRIIAVLSSKQPSLESFLQPFETMVVGDTAADRRRILYVLNSLDGPVDEPERKLGRWAKHVHHVLPHDPEALAAANEAGAPSTTVSGSSPFAEAAQAVALDVYLEHSFEVFLPIEKLDAVEAKVEEAAQVARDKLTSLFDRAPERDLVDLTGDDEEAPVPYALRLRTKATADQANAAMSDFLELADDTRLKLGCDRLLVKIDGRPSLI